jgi:hypothetical protein
MTHSKKTSTKVMNPMLAISFVPQILEWFKRFFCLLLVALALCGSARAQWTPYSTPKYDVSGAFAFTRAYGTNSGSFHLIGGDGEFTYHVRQWFAVTADAGAYNFRNLPAGMTSTMYTAAGGPRITFRNLRRITPFAHVLFGVGRLTASSGGINAGENSFVVLAGGGIDVPFTERFTIRAVQVDYLSTRFGLTSGASGTQQNLRLSAGLVIRIGEK